MKNAILKDSLDILNEKRDLSSQMNKSFKTCSQDYNIDKGTCVRVKDYYHYKGRKCESSDILKVNKNSDEKFPDRVAPCFRKLNQIIYDLAAVDDLSFLDEYLKSLKNKGITISIDPSIKEKVNKNSTDIKKKIKEIDSEYQDQICSLADDLRDNKSREAEDNKLCKKKFFKTVLNIYDKRKSNKKYRNKLVDIKSSNDTLEKTLDEIDQGNYD